MYILDVNFLNDRPEYRPDVGSGPSRPKAPSGSLTPLFLGVATGVFLPAAMIVLWLVLQNRNAELTARIDTLNAQLGELQKAEEKVAAINAEAGQIKAETNALATVFNQIKPWSAILEDIRDRIPPGVQIDTIQQTAATAPLPIVSASPTASISPTASVSPTASAPPTPPSPQPVTKIQIQGTARSFNDVNDFLLILQRSTFFQDNQTQLVTAKLIDNPIAIESQKSQQGNGSNLEFKLPKVVQYIIEANLNDVTTAKLLRELERKGAVGLVTRIRTLQDKGVIQK